MGRSYIKGADPSRQGVLGRVKLMPGPIDEHREDVRTGSSEAADKIVDLKLGASALAAIPPLPKIYGEDKRISRAEEYFRFSQRYQYVRLLGHGAYGLVWYPTDGFP